LCVRYHDRANFDKRREKEASVQELFKRIAESIATGVEGGAALIIAYGAIEAMFGAVRSVAGGHTKRGQPVITPTWTDIGQLAAIGVIRTFLNYFLEKDLERYEPKESETEKVRPVQATA
jgi:hypothetical protein